MDNKYTPQSEIVLTDRQVFKTTGILEVESFDEKEVIAASKMGPLVIKGEGLHITQLNLEGGQLVVEGAIYSFQYMDDHKGKIKAKSKGIMERLFR